MRNKKSIEASIKPEGWKYYPIVLVGGVPVEVEGSGCLCHWHVIGSDYYYDEYVVKDLQPATKKHVVKYRLGITLLY